MSISIVLLLATVAVADAKPKIEIDPSFGSVAQVFSLHVIIENQSASSITKPIFESDENFRIQQRHTFTRRDTINNSDRYQIVFTFSVTPSLKLRPGRYRVPDGLMTIEGSKIPLPGPEVEITELKGKTDDGSTEALEGVSFTHLVNNPTPYVGEQILYRAELASSLTVRIATLAEIDQPGFLRESFGDERQTQRRIGNITRTSVMEALFPTKPGELRIPKRDLTLQVELPRKQQSAADRLFRRNPWNRDPFAVFDELFDEGMNPFAVQVVDKVLTAPVVSVKVKPLPDPLAAGLKAAPEGYLPVGTLEITANLSSETVHLGESVTMELTLSGDANLRPYELPKPDSDVSRNFKSYFEKPELEVKVSPSGATFKKTFRVSYVPQRVGEFALPSIPIVWFDPKQEKYFLRQISSKNISVLPAEGEGQSQQKVSEPNSRAPIKAETDLREAADEKRDLAPDRSPKRFLPESLPWSLFFFVIAVAAVLTVGSLFRSSAPSRHDSIRRKKRRALKQIRSSHTVRDLLPAFLHYLASEFSARDVNLTAREGVDLIREQDLPEELKNRLASFLSSLEHGVYGAVDIRPDDAEELVREGRSLIAALERARNKRIRRFFLLSCIPLLTAAFATLEAKAASEVVDVESAYSKSLSGHRNEQTFLFNYGNSCYRNGQFGKALALYERALVLAPHGGDILENLFRTIVHFPLNIQQQAMRTLEETNVTLPFSLGELQVVVLVVWCITLACLVRARQHFSRPAISSFLLSLLLLGLSGIELYNRHKALLSLPAIVLVPDSRVLAAAKDDAQIVALLPEGSPIRVFQQIPAWVRVELEGGRTGWLKSENIANIGAEIP